jgi:hypothetical protein
MSKKYKKFLNFKNLFFLLLILIIHFNYKGVLQNWSYLYKDNNSFYETNKYPEDLVFFNKVINEYFEKDNLSSPTFYFSPYELGIHILGDGYRLNDFRVKNKYLIKNKNSLISVKNKHIYKDNLKITAPDTSNIHGIFIDINDTAKKIYYHRNNESFLIENSRLVSCDDMLEKQNFFANKKKYSKKIISHFKNCKYYQFYNKNNLPKSIKLLKNEKILFDNVNKIEIYGNDIDINPYVILDFDLNNYNYFYSVDKNYVN